MTVLRDNKFSAAGDCTILPPSSIIIIIQTSCADPRALSHQDASDPGFHYPKVHQTWHPAYSENTLSEFIRLGIQPILKILCQYRLNLTRISLTTIVGEQFQQMPLGRCQSSSTHNFTFLLCKTTKSMLIFKTPVSQVEIPAPHALSQIF